MSDVLVERLDLIRQRIAGACERAGRSPETVRLLPITKKISPEVVGAAAECGLSVFGENRVQEAVQKSRLCPGHLDWHLVGHLQRNKVKHAVRLFSMIHSVDTPSVLVSIEGACEEVGISMPICLQVNVSGESSKFGMGEDEVLEVLIAANAMRRVEVVGLMTIPPFTEDPEEARPHFRRLRELRDEVRESRGIELTELSMGMSHDFEVAIEEGATWIRVGTLLFGERET